MSREGKKRYADVLKHDGNKKPRMKRLPLRLYLFSKKMIEKNADDNITLQNAKEAIRQEYHIDHTEGMSANFNFSDDKEKVDVFVGMSINDHFCQDGH